VRTMSDQEPDHMLGSYPPEPAHALQDGAAHP
jgi:hypothetical protein